MSTYNLIQDGESGLSVRTTLNQLLTAANTGFTGVYYQINTNTFPSNANSGDVLLITQDGTSGSTVSQEWIYNGSGWTPISTSSTEVYYRLSGATFPTGSTTGDFTFITNDGTSGGTVTQQYIYDGLQWKDFTITGGTGSCVSLPIYQQFGNQSSFLLAYEPLGAITVFNNGVQLPSSGYTLSGNSVTINPSITNLDIRVLYFYTVCDVPSGTSGTSGVAGPTGPSGTSGTSGAAGDTGTSGTSGIGFNFLGEWLDINAYGVNDVVRYGNPYRVYTATENVGINESTPDVNPKWSLMVVSGINGTSGSSGTSGVGTAGTSGTAGTAGTSGRNATNDPTYFEAFTGITQGRAVRLGQNGKIYPMDFVGVENQPIIGIAQTSGSTGSLVGVILEGGLSTVTSGLTPSYNYYADTNGSISLTGATYVGTALSGSTLQVWFGNPNGVETPSLSIIDNSITDPDNITAIGRYIVPASGNTGVFVGESNDYADYNGTSFTFTVPTNNDKAVITTGPNAGNVYIFSTGATSGWTLSSQSSVLSTSNWASGSSYKQFDLVIYQNFLYQANGDIPANTAFTPGTSGATWKAINNGVIPEYSSVYPTSGSTTNSSTFADLPGSTLTLPSAGTYRVYYNMTTTANVDNNATIFTITNSSNTIYDGSNSVGSKISGVFFASMATQEIVITVNAATTIKMRWRTNGTGISTLVNNANPSNSVFGYEKIAGFAPVVGQTTSSRSATLSATIPGGGTVGTDITGVTFSVGTIPLSNSGVWTLTAGVTYQIECSVAYDAGGTNQFQGDTFIQFVDATTNTPLPNQNGASTITPFFTTRGLSRDGYCIFQYTPSTNQTIKLRVTFQNNSGFVNAQTFINQLGTTNSSAFTGVISPTWNIGNTYPLGSMAVNQGVLYQANSLVPAGTAFTTGTSGSTWTQIGLLNGQVEYGNVYPTNGSSIGSTGTTFQDLPGSTLTLPSAGTYKVYYNVGVQSSTAGGNTSFVISDSSNVNYSGSAGNTKESAASTIAVMATQEIFLTITTPTTIKLRWKNNGTGTSNLINNDSTCNSVFGYEKIAGFLPVSYGVPNWTTVGTIQSVGISAGAASPTTPVAPTLPSNTTINTIMYKQLGTKTHSVRGSLAVPSATLTGNNVGTGDYLFTLPYGLQFDTSVIGQSVYTGDTLANSSILLMKVIPGSYASANNTTTYTQGWSVGIVPYSATQYRVVLPVYASGVRCFGSIWFQLVNNQLEEIDWQFDFQSL
jgi:hypothetical protein